MTPTNRCWASDVSECGGGLSREHYITRGIWLGRGISVGGLPHLKGERMDVTIEDIVARVLCKNHNAQLSSLDQALVDLVNCVREIARIRSVRAHTQVKRHREIVFVVDGVAIERCVLKMVMNVAHVLRRNMGDWVPPPWLPEVIFGKRALVEGAGLAICARVGDQIREMEAVRVGFGKAAEDGEPTGLSMELRDGMRFVCTWGKAIRSFPGFGIDGDVYLSDGVLLHPRTFHHADVALTLNYDWSGTWRENHHKNVVALRAKYKSPAR
jgi:hypothetical protein